MSNIVKINAAEYGLEESKAQQISAMFKPMLDKMVELEKEYNKIIKLEITEENCLKFKELRLKYVKVRTGTADIHKKQKQFYLQGGRFVDGWKNAQLMASTGIEDELMKREKHFETIKLQEIAKLKEERTAELQKYEQEVIPADIGIMKSEVWDNYIVGVKAAYQARIEAEKKAEEERIAKEKAEKLRVEKEDELKPYWNFVPEEHPAFEDLSDSEWGDFFEEIKAAKLKYDEEQQRIKDENKRLEKERKDAEDKAAKDKADAEAKRTKDIEGRSKKAIKFLKDNGFKDDPNGVTHNEFHHFIGSRNYTEFETDKELESFCSETTKSLQAAKANKEKEDALKKLKKKEVAEAKAKADETARVKAAAQAPDKDKLQSIIDALDLGNHSFSTDAGKAVHNQIEQKFNGFKKWATEQIESL